MDYVLKKIKLPQLTQQEIDNSNIPLTIKEIESVRLKLPKEKSPGQLDSLQNSTKYLKKNSQHFQTMAPRKQNGEGTLPNPFLEACIILISKPYKDYQKKKKKTKQSKKNQIDRSIAFMNTDANILKKILANAIQQYIKGIAYHDHVQSRK